MKLLKFFAFWAALTIMVPAAIVAGILQQYVILLVCLSVFMLLVAWGHPTGERRGKI